MAKQFNNGVIVYDAQVAKFDMTLMASENIDFPANVIKSLNYLAADVVYEYDLSFDIATIRQGELQKLARMGHIQAAKAFTAAESLAAEQARVGLKGQLEGYADQAEVDAKAYTDAREVALQSNIAAEASTARSAEQANALAHSTFKTAQETFNGDIGMEVTNHKAERVAADATLTAGLAAELVARAAAVNGVTVSLATEATTARAAESVLTTNLAAQVAKEAAYETSNNAALALETSNRMSSDAFEANASATDRGAIRSEIAAAKVIDDAAMASEATARAAADATLTSGLAAQVSKEAAYEVSNNAALAAQVAKEAAYETSNDSALAAQVAKEAAYETSNDSALAAQVAKQAGDETARTAAIAAAKSAADALLVSAKEAADAKVETEEARIDAILLASSADKDSFAEIVTLINNVDTVNDDALAVVIGNLNSEIASTNAEMAAAASARGVIQADVDANEVASDASFAAAATARAAIITQHGVDDQAAAAARGGIQSALDAQEAKQESERAAMDAAYKAADATLTAAVSSEASTARAAEGVLTADLAAQVAKEAAYEAFNNAALSDEEAARIAADASAAAFDLAARAAIIAQHGADDAAAAAGRAAIQADVDQNEADADAAIAAEKSRAEVAELALTNAVSVEAAARLSGDTLIRGTTEGGGVFAGSLFGLDQAMATKEAASIAADATLTSGLAAQVAKQAGDETARDGAIAAAKALADAAIIAEAGVRSSAEAGIQADVDQNEADADAAQIALSNSISAEQQRASAAEVAIAADLAQELLDRAAADTAAASFNLAARSTMQADVDANEASASGSFAAALAARGVLTAGLAAELSARTAADVQGLADAASYTDAEIVTMQASLDAEIAATNIDILAAEQGRVGLQAGINVEKGRIDAILAGAGADADSFAEIVTLINSVDTTNDTAFAGHVSAYNTKMGLLDGVDAAASTDRAAVRSELAAEKATLQAEFAAADAAALTASELAASTEKTERIAAEADEIAARVAGDQAEATTRGAAIAAEESDRIAGDTALQTSLTSEVNRATAFEGQLQGKITDMHNGETTVNFISNAVASASIMMPNGFAHQIVSNSGASAIATLPVLGANFKMTLSFAAAGSEAMEFQAPAGKTIDGEADGKVTLYPGSAVTFLENAGVYYMM